MRHILILLGALMGTGCFGPISIPMVNPAPRFRTPDSQVQQPLAVYIDPQIQDNITAQSAGLKDFKITAFRKSIEAGFKNSIFAKTFSGLSFVDQKNAAPIVLALDWADPKPLKVATLRSVNQYGATVGTNAEIRFKISYAAAIIKNGKRLVEAKSDAVSEESAHDIFSIDAVLRSSLEKMLTELGDSLLTTQVLSELQTS